MLSGVAIKIPSGAYSKSVRKRPSVSNRAASAFFCSLISRTIFEAPMIFPSASLIGEMVAETLKRLPSFRTRTVSKWRTRSPRPIRARMSTSSCRRSAGNRRVIGWPIISAALYPNILSAEAFQLVMTPLSVLLMIASSLDSTMAGNCRITSSARRRSVASSCRARLALINCAVRCRTRDSVSSLRRLSDLAISFCKSVSALLSCQRR